jgi:hypothetical protein
LGADIARPAHVTTLGTQIDGFGCSPGFSADLVTPIDLIEVRNRCLPMRGIRV